MKLHLIAASLLLAAPLAAQSIELDPFPGTEGYDNQIRPEAQRPAAPAPREAAVTAPGAVLRGLDKVDGTALDIELRNGEDHRLGRLNVHLGECRYPEGNPAGDAYAWLEVTDPSRNSTLFEGWMVASSPALNPLDHPRYDVWVLRCITS